MLAAPARIANTDAAARAPVRSLDEARGLLVANDADVKRCQLLASRAARRAASRTLCMILRIRP